MKSNEPNLMIRTIIKHFLVAVTSLIVGLPVVSCQEEEAVRDGGYVEFRFEKSAFTRADIAEDGSGHFTDGDKVALYAGDRRFSLTLDEGRWTPAIARSELGEGAVTLTAYYPVAEESAGDAGEGYIHTLHTDQSKAENYAASDLLTASELLEAGELQANLLFSHAMHRVLITLVPEAGSLPGNLTVKVLSRVRNRLSASDLEVADGSQEWITANPLGEGRYAAIVAPQSTETFRSEWIRISAEDGKSALFTLPGEVADERFEPGRQTEVTLTVRQSGQTKPYKITFDPNGGEGEMQPVYFDTGEEVALPYNQFTRRDGTFSGWSLSADGLAKYADGQTITPEARDLTLYANWRIDPTKFGGPSERFKGQTVWAKGIVPPAKEDWVQVKAWDVTDGYDGKTVVYDPKYGWYDVGQGHKNMCWAASASNILLWWMDQNKEYIDRYGYDGPKGYGGKEYPYTAMTSPVFDYFVQHWPNRGNWTQDGFWWFIAGSSDRDGGGFFKEVFEGKELYEYRYSERIHKNSLAYYADKALGEGGAMGLDMDAIGNPHQYTVWGAEFDDEGYVKGLFYTNSADDSERPSQPSDKYLGLIYMEITNDKDGYICTEASIPGSYIYIWHFQIYLLGQDIWEEYFRTHPGK